ncbi:mRNA interferase HicA [Candidatus Magnetomoraceae bacterium gMMP-15]
MNSKQVIKLLKKDEWFHVRTTGDHWHFRHSQKQGIVTVPHPKKDLPIGTLKSIQKQSGIKFKK